MFGQQLLTIIDHRQVDDPIEIIKRLMIGSEGTLGFVAQATYNTVPEWPHKVWHPCFARLHHCTAVVLGDHGSCRQFLSYAAGMTAESCAPHMWRADI